MPSRYPFVFDIMLRTKTTSASPKAKQLRCICGWNPQPEALLSSASLSFPFFFSLLPYLPVSHCYKQL